MSHLYKYISICTIIIASLIISACQEPKDPVDDGPVEQMVLIYAVNHNNLSSDLVLNEQQILQAMGNVNTNRYKLLLYKFIHQDSTNGLYSVENENGTPTLKLIKKYDDPQMSIESERIKDVIDYAVSLYPEAEKDLFFWGHGSGWVNPNKYSATKPAGNASESQSLSNEEESVSPQSFGGEYPLEGGRTMNYIDIDQLANSIPDNVFNIIWFDCCYMSSIEVAYQLRNKCDTYVAYPTEIMADGLPYNRILPKILGQRDVNGAAQELYEYYTSKSSSEPVTVAVMKMDKLQKLADVSRRIFDMGSQRPTTESLQNYSRFSNAPYYDFGQYMREYISKNTDEGDSNESLEEALKSALNDFVVYKLASERDFHYPVGYPILPENYSGISIHNYEGKNTEREEYYRKLDWYKATGKIFNK